MNMLRGLFVIVVFLGLTSFGLFVAFDLYDFFTAQANRAGALPPLLVRSSLLVSTCAALITFLKQKWRLAKFFFAISVLLGGLLLLPLGET